MQTAEALARVQQPEPELLAMPSSEEVASAATNIGERLPRYFKATAELSPADRSAAVSGIVEVAKKRKLTTAGIYSNADVVEGIFNSRGVSDWYEQTSAEVSITMLDTTSSGWQKANAADATELDPLRMAEIAAQKALDSINPRDLEPGKYTVILEPSAVLDIVGFMFWDFSGAALLEQRSFLNERIGSQLFGENITVWDDAYHPLQTGAPFDGEGMKRHRVKLIENGVVQNVVYARGSAQKMQLSELRDKVGVVHPTGHGFSLPNEMGEAPLNIVFSGPSSGEARAVDEMVADTERGSW